MTLLEYMNNNPFGTFLICLTLALSFGAALATVSHAIYMCAVKMTCMCEHCKKERI